MDNKDFSELVKLWTDIFLRLKKMGEILLKNKPPSVEANVRLPIKEVEFQAEKRDKNGKVVYRQSFKSTPDGKIRDNRIENN